MRDEYVNFLGDEVLLSDVFEAIDRLGYVAVPKVATPRMREACNCRHGRQAQGECSQEIWASMIAARPTFSEADDLAGETGTGGNADG